MYRFSKSPDMNPMERLWLVIKSAWFKDYACKTREELVERFCKALWGSSKPSPDFSPAICYDNQIIPPFQGYHLLVDLEV
jgi:hypothetical protein